MIAVVLLGLTATIVFQSAWPVIASVPLAWAWRVWGGDFLMGVREGRESARAEKAAIALRCEMQNRQVLADDPMGIYGSDYTLIMPGTPEWPIMGSGESVEPTEPLPGTFYPPGAETQPQVRMTERESYPTYPRPDDWHTVVDLDATGAVR